MAWTRQQQREYARAYYGDYHGLDRRWITSLIFALCCLVMPFNGGETFADWSPRFISEAADIGSQLPFGSLLSPYYQLVSGTPQTFRKIDKTRRYVNEKPSESSDEPFGPISRVVVTASCIFIAFCMQLSAYGLIDQGRNVYGRSLLGFGIILGFLGPFSLVGDWWNRLVFLLW